MDPAQALADLTEISSQIQAAALVDAEGGVLASTLADGTRASEFAQAAQELVRAAEDVRSPAGETLTQLEVATGEGSVFVVRDADRAIAATTTAEPTVGLVFYDLKSCLRSAAEQPVEETKEQPAAPAKPKRARKKSEEPKAEEPVAGKDDAA